MATQKLYPLNTDEITVVDNTSANINTRVDIWR